MQPRPALAGPSVFSSAQVVLSWLAGCWINRASRHVCAGAMPVTGLDAKWTQVETSRGTLLPANRNGYRPMVKAGPFRPMQPKDQKMLIPHGATIVVADGANLELFRNAGQEARPKLTPLKAPKLEGHSKDSGKRHRASTANPDER